MSVNSTFSRYITSGFIRVQCSVCKGVERPTSYREDDYCHLCNNTGYVLMTENFFFQTNPTITMNKSEDTTAAKPDGAMPSYYTDHKVSPIDLIEEYNLNFKLGCVVKYVARHKEKNGREDLRKALWYLLSELGMTRDNIEVILTLSKVRDV